MNEIQKFIREQAQQAAGECMAGDLSISVKQAIEIAEEATKAALAALAAQPAQDDGRMVALLQIACALMATGLRSQTMTPDEARAHAFETVRLGAELFGTQGGADPW